MSIEITVPRLGWSMEEGAFCRWLISEGDMVREGDGLFELEGDKATQVVESFDAGILHIGNNGPQQGDIVKVGQVLGHLEPRSSRTAGPKTPTAAAKTASTNGHRVTPASTAANVLRESAPVAANSTAPLVIKSEGQAAAADKAIRNALASVPIASPTVRRLARELGVDLQTVSRGDTYPVSASDILRLAAEDAASSTAATSANRVAVTPRAKRVAQQLGVDASNAVGTGRDGRVRERDIREIATGQVSAPKSRTPALQSTASGEPITHLRRVIAQRMMAASHETAPVTLTTQADASDLVRFREECKRTSAERGVIPPSYTELFVKLCAAALQKHPTLLDQWIDERIIRAEGIHIAVAVATPNGLVTPVIRDVPSLSLRELSNSFAQLVELARSQQLKAEQMRGGAFTISSLGGYRVEAFTPILNPPQTAILGVGRISEQPIVKQKQLAIADVVTLSLTFDHRVVDGAPAAAFLTSLCEVIENPLAWLLG